MENKINNTGNFTGGVFVVNKLSAKPSKCINSQKGELISLIKKEPFDLFIKQDYRENEILIIGKNKRNSQGIETIEKIPVNSKAQTYTQTAKNLIESHKKHEEQHQWDIWESKHKPHTLKEKLSTLLQKTEDFIWKVFSDAEEIN